MERAPESVKAQYSREDYEQALKAAQEYLIKDALDHPYLTVHMVCIIDLLKEKLVYLSRNNPNVT
jgi:hypothetical protein